ncbi:putative porin [Ferruginibacter sp.]|uniref:putative porin n=1 Tax=Ferruginibacter sp. TaxID=1940288 RepID=UPI0019BD8AC3|nr:putative porin [Ferruginibacter sp.]MBC7626074.1 hypothetical protein [Ferruginibacter sp.]
MYKIIFSLLLLGMFQFCIAQNPLQSIKNVGRGMSGSGGGGKNKGDSMGLGFEHRDDLKDSITVTFKYLDSIRNIRIDSNLNDFYKYFPIPAAQQYLGNNGNAGYSLIYAPFAKAGWDAGFHAFDAYRFTLENSRFFKTTKPFTRMNYELGSAKEQVVSIIHTQNPKPNLNFGLEYRLISAPGYFSSQNTNHKSYRLFSNYQGKRKRYAGYFMIMGNVIKSSENGGIQNDSNLTDKNYKLFAIPVNLGGTNSNFNPFNTTVNTGNVYKDFTFFLRQSYDLGKKDSIAINDSTTEYLFYSKLRFQHTFTYNNYSYQFRDLVAGDSSYYKNFYNTAMLADTLGHDSLVVTDKWKVITNDFSILTYPNTKNVAQYLLAGARIENINGTFSSGTHNFYNIILHGEYRNKTRNRLWDILANGELYMAGLNSGDYNINASLARYLNKRWGNIRLAFTNVNRTPSFIYNPLSSFNFGNAGGYKKENIITLKAAADNPFVSLSAANYLITNYAYFTGYYKTAQYSTVINLLQLSAAKKIKLSKRWNWYAEVTLQQTDAAAPVKVPLIFTRNRIAYEGVFFKNLNLSTGIEFRYYTPYKANNYSPVMGQFFVQDSSYTLKNRPDISAFLHFRIKSFTAFIRAENLNTINFANGFGFTQNNFAAPHYAYPGLVIRFGIQWNFVN